MGGGVLKTASKVGSIGSFNFASVGETSRRATRLPKSSFVPPIEQSSSFVPAISSCPAQTETPAVNVVARWPDWEFDDWEFAGSKEDSIESVDFAPRIVFSHVPSIQEATEATSDLKDALQKVYFTPDHTLGSHGECKTPAHCEDHTVSAVPKHVAQMFSLLQGSSEAQVVVASLAADKNVWDAVMKNEKVLEFCNNPSPAVTQIYADSAESVAENKPDSSTLTTEDQIFEGSFVMDLLTKIKVKVSQMVSNISDYLQDIFGISNPSDENKYSNMTLGTSFMALAVGTILIILLKRG